MSGKPCLIGIGALLLAVASAGLAVAEPPRMTGDVIYGHKDGMALVFHVYRPPEANGAGVIQIVSGGYFSPWQAPEARLGTAQPFLKHRFTVFTVFHGSNPKYNVVEIVEDVRRAVRFIRLHAADFGVEQERIGVMGGSAGGHLALVLATTGDDGDAAAQDPVLRASSRVAAAVAIAPPVDLRDPDKILQRALERGGIDQGGVDRLKPALNFDPALAATISPVLHVTPDDAPTLLIHGDADQLVPFDNSQRIYAEFQEKHVPSELIVLAGVGHGPQAAAHLVEFQRAIDRGVAWFDKHLAARAKPE
jgi:acetyl esterase/lipase